MPSGVAFANLDNLPIQTAEQELRNCHENNLDSSQFDGKANSLSVPIGEEPSQGFLLMLRQDVDQLTLGNFHTLTFGVGSESITVKGLVFRSAYRLFSGISQDPLALYLVEL